MDKRLSKQKKELVTILINYLKKTGLKILFAISVIAFINIYFILLCGSRLFLEDLIYLDIILCFLLIVVIIFDYLKYLRLVRLEKWQLVDKEELNLVCSKQIVNIFAHNQKYYEQKINYLNNQIQDLSDYISKWSHEAKLPLASLRLMNERNENVFLKKDIRETIERLQLLLNTMLMSSKLKNPENDIKIERIQLTQVIKEAIKHQSYFLINKHFSIDIQFDDIYVYNDRRWLTYMLDQFIANSIKYCQESPCLIFKIIENEAITLVVEDNGIGISKEDMPYIFDRGFVGSNLRDGDYRSTGMGLYFVKDIAKKLNIEVQVDQNFHMGTRFFIKFKDNRDYFFLD